MASRVPARGEPRSVTPYLGRPRLYELLDEEHPVLAVAAPPGWGKSLLVAGWARDRGIAESISWQSAGGPVTGPLTELRRVVLDDLHRLAADEAAAWLRRVVESGVPCLALSRLPLTAVVREVLGVRAPEITLDDLRFTDPEIRELLEKAEQPATRGLVGRVSATTGGWPIAVHNAVLSPRGARPGIRSRVLEYVEDEILADLPQPLAELAMSLAVVDHCDRSLAETLAPSEAVAGLGALVERRILVRDGDTYRLLPGLGACLEELLRRRCEATHVALQGRAADWFVDRGDLPTALTHAQRAGDGEKVAALLRQTWVELVLTAPRRLREALAALPDGGRGDRELRLAAAAAWSQEDPQTATSLLRGVQPLPEPEPEPEPVAGVGEERLRVALLENAVAVLVTARAGVLPARGLVAAEDLVIALTGLPAEPGAGLRSAATVFALVQGTLRLQLGRLGPAEELLQLAAGHASLAGLPTLESLALAHLALCRILAGELQSATETLARCPEAPPGRTALAAVALATGMLDLERGNLAPARRHLAEARRDLREPSLMPLLWHAEGVADLLVGDYEVGLERLDGVGGADTTTAYLAELVAGTRTLLALRVEGAEPHHVTRGSGTAWGRMALATEHLLAGRSAEALSVATQESSGPGERGRTRVDLLLLAGAAALELGDRSASLAATERALGRADVTGARRALHQLPRSLVARQLSLVEAASASAPSRERAEVARRRLGLVRFAGAQAPALSRRELLVLSHLGTGRAVAAIAADLFVSPNTLKTQLRSIYRKLGVASRSEAVERGRELGIVS